MKHDVCGKPTKAASKFAQMGRTHNCNELRSNATVSLSKICTQKPTAQTERM
jgi:hypothetical protein